MDYIKLSIPVFFLLIGIELLIDRLRKTHYYRFNDAVTNLSCGIGSQVSGIFLKVLTFAGYVFIYEHYSPLKGIMPNVWWSFVLLFIGVDFFYYWFHRLAHEISVMWGSHVVHHQSEEYNLTVALRQAWVQGAFSWVFYLPLAFMGFEPMVFATIASFQTLYQFWIHTKFIEKLHPAFEYIFNTPSHHRVHHGVNPQYIDRNHGGTLIIFDRLFNTFEPEQEAVVYGITKQPKSWNPIYVNFEYWVDLFKQVLNVKSATDKLKMLFYMPGWKPKELGGNEIPKAVSIKSFVKYDSRTSLSFNLYVLAQFTLILAGTTFFLFSYKQLSIWQQLTIAALIIYSLTNIGGLLESKKWVYYLEAVRLIILPQILFFIYRERDIINLFFFIMLGIAIISFIWLIVAIKKTVPLKS